MHAGTRIAHYEIVSAIGRGGMGEVWQARDTKLKRDVALKMLPPDLASDSDRIARLEREATLIAALNHPNVAAIYGIEEHEGRWLLVLELVEGATLDDRLRAGPLRPTQALEIALQIAGALEAAHDRGVVHRDLKPANIKITPDGRVKVLDFGLAKSLAPDATEPMNATGVRTEIGVVMGTAPYMSPEQARGEAAGRQTDIWSFGVVLYEMLTGISPFERDSGNETLARVLEAQPDYGALPAATPASARRLIRRCLEKDLKRRFRDMADVRIDVEDALAALAAEPVSSPDATRPARFRLRAIAAVLALIVLVPLAGLGVRSLTARIEEPASVARLAIASLEPRFAQPFGTQHLAISPDGSRIAYAGASGIWIRRLRDQQAVRLESESTNPFFSPDGEWVGFGNLEKAPAAGGAVTPLSDNTERPVGATWAPDGTIVFATSGGLYAMSASGGERRLLAKPDAERGELAYAWPHFLPGGDAVLFNVLPRGSIEAAQIVRLDLRSLERKTVLTGGTSPRYVPTGHLLYAAGQQLMAVPFDLDSATTHGEPVALRDIPLAVWPDNGAAEFAVSENGTLVFIAPDPRRPPPLRKLVWMDRAGNEEPLALEPGAFGYPRVSPDGSRIALDVLGANRDIWIWDVFRESFTRLTDGPNEDMVPLWSPDGRRVFFSSARSGNFDIYSQPADGSTPARVELADPKFHSPASFSPDGVQLVVGEEFRDLGLLDLRDSTLRPLLQREAIDWSGEISPDGNWLAYESDESGRFEVYLRPLSDLMSRREQVSTDGGGYLHWGPARSNELYYIDAEGVMMAVPVELSPALRIGRPTKLFEVDPALRPGRGGKPYDVAQTDGRFILTKVAVETRDESTTIAVILNWFEELREQVPVR